MNPHHKKHHQLQLMMPKPQKKPNQSQLTRQKNQKKRINKLTPL
ncbi:hypothetical protein A5875_002165 [Enterococcus sp. 3H8_DIV0648]|nr:hypothetical protein A5875_002165 [Enterococcus sp. 3H8_DIV0648]